MRKATGIDDIDITTDESGGTGLRLGKYLTDDIYSNVEIDSHGDATINLNLDISKSVTVKGRYGTNNSNSNQAESGIGIYFQRDY